MIELLTSTPAALLWLALSAGLQWFTLRRTRQGRRRLRWLTLLPAALVALLAVLSLLGAISSFYAFFAALEMKNALLAVLSLVGLWAGSLFFLLLPPALLWLAGWGLGWALEALERYLRQKRPPGEGGPYET